MDFGQDRFHDRVQGIVDELTLAAKWDRPSLVVAAYRSEISMERLQTMLHSRLQGAGLSLQQYLVDRQHYDVPRDLREVPDRARTIFSVSGMRRGGGRGYSNAYRALNMHREFLVEGSVRAIFWLTVPEARQCARFAPDFWAFRHLVVEFLELPTEDSLAQPGVREDLFQTIFNDPPEDLRERIYLNSKLFRLGCLEEALRGLQQTHRKYPREKAILLQIAEVHLAMLDPEAARRALKRIRRSRKDTDPFLAEVDRLERASRSVPPRGGGIQNIFT